MKLVLIPSVLLTIAGSANAQGPTESADTWSWCVTDATSANGPVRYFSEPFEGDIDQWIPAAYVEYVRSAYATRDGTRDFAATCRTDTGLPANRASLEAAMTPEPGVRDVTTGWRFHFE